MITEQPARDSAAAPAEPQGDGVRAAAQALAQRRWAHRQELAAEAPANPEVTKPDPHAQQTTAPESEEPASESDLEDGQLEGEETEVDEGEEVTEEEDSEEEQPASVIDLDSLDEDAKLVVDGQETTVREIRESRMRLDDYTRKTQALARQREVHSEREKLAAFAMGQQEQQLVDAIQQLQGLNWQELAQKNPQQFAAKKAEYEGTQLRLQQVQKQKTDFLQQIKRFEDQLTQHQAQVATAELKKLIPGWNNGLYYSLVDYAADVGFPREAVLKYTDPHVFLILQKARAYDQAKKVTTKKSIKPSPTRTPKATGPKDPQKQTGQQLEQIRDQAAKSGTIDSAIELLKAKRQLSRM
jgi:hypothetical protein